MATDPDINVTFTVDTSGYTPPITEAAIEAAVAAVRLATREANQATDDAEAKARVRAEAVANLVKLCGGNQSEAARRIGLDQSRVNRLVQKARAHLAGTQVNHLDGDPRNNELANLELRDTPTEEAATP